MMKKYIVISCILILTLFSSCNNDPIFYGIEQEIKLADPVVKGNVWDMTEAGGKLYAVNGRIFTKTSDSADRWTEVNKPSGYIIRIASDDTYLYALSSDKKLYTTLFAGNLNWVSLEDSVVELFDNNAASTDKRAFIRKDSGVYEVKAGIVNGTTITIDGASSSSVTAEFIGATTFFSSSIQFTSNKSGILYRISGKNIEYSNDNTEWTAIYTITGDPLSLEFYMYGTSSSLLVGTKKGIVHLALSGTAASETAVPGSNADSCFGNSEVHGIYAYPHGKGIVYTASLIPSNTKNTKFWSFYPTRGNWNLE